MVEVKPAPDLIAEGYTKLQHACQHDEYMEKVASHINDPEEMSAIYQDLKGTRRIIFSLLLDLNII